MKADISTKNRKALSIPQKGSVHKSAILLESKCKKESDDTISYQFLFKRTAKRPDLLAVLSMFSKGTHINLDDGDYVIENHDYTIKTLKKGIKVSGGFSMVPLALSNPHVKQMTALEDFNHEYSKMEMIQPDTYFRVYPYQNFNGPAFRAKLFSYVSNMGENYGYCDSGSLYYRRASLVMPKIKITKAIPQAKMMFHTHPKKDEPSLSSPDDFLLYFDLSHKPRNIRHFYTVMADRMDYFHITPKHDKKNDYVKIDEDKFIEKLDKKMDEIAKIYDEKLPSKTDADNLYYCERITKDVVKWLNKEYSRYFKIKYKCHYRVKKNPDKDTGESLHLGDAFLAKALNDIKAGDYTWPEFEADTLPHEKYAYWYSLYHGMRMDRSGIGFSRVVSLQPGDSRRLDYFGLKRFEGTQFDYFDIINILLLNYDISMADAKVRDGKGTTSRIAEILDFLELEDEKSREDLVLLTQVLESGIYSDEARTLAGDHYFILPIIESCVLALQAIEEVNSQANMKLTPKEQKVVYELKKYELILHSEKAGAATAAALGDLYNKTFAGTPNSLRPNPPLSKKQMQYTGHLPKHSMANVGLLSDVLKEFAPSRLDMPQNYETERGQLSLRVKAEEEIVTIKLTLSSGNMQIFSYSDEAAIEAVRKVIEVMKPYIDFRPEDDIDNIGVITNEPVRNPKNAVIISVASPIQKTKNEVLTSLEKRLRDSTIATTYTTRILREYEKRPHLVEVSDDMYNRLVSNGDIIMGISYGDSERRGYKRSDFEKSKYVLVDTMVRDQDLLSRADSSIISFYLHPTNTKGNVEKYLQNYVSPQEAKKVTSLLDYLKDMASGDTFDHVIDYDINKPSFVIEEVFKEVPKSNPKGPDPLGQTIFGDGSRYLSAQTIPITALQNIRTGVLAATIAGPPLLNPKQPSVITISGPSGSGKSTILKKISKITGAVMIPTVTTRERRPKEQLGQDRIFVTKEEFQTMIADGEFVEWKKMKNGHYYGRRYSDFKDISIVDVSLKGMKEYKKKFFNTFSIFLKPNVSAEVLASHMRKRGGMSESERKGRADIIGKLLESASKMDFDLVVTSRVGEYEKVAEEIVPQLPPKENPPLTYDLMSVVTGQHLRRMNDRLFPEKMKGWDKRTNVSKDRLIKRSKKFREDLEYAYGWTGRTAKSAIEAILTDYANSFNKNGYAKVYRGLITLPSENLEEVWDKYGVGWSWSTYKEGADDYVSTAIHNMPGAVLVLVEGRVHITDVVNHRHQLNLRIGYPLEKEIEIDSKVEVIKYSIWSIDPDDRVKTPKWRTTGKGWQPWLRRGIKPLKVVEVNKTFVADTPESGATQIISPSSLPNPKEDYYAIVDGKPVYSKTKKNPNHCPIEVEARRAATDPSFKHHKWYVEHHLDYVMAIMKRMPKVMGNWDKEMVDMVWMHDYPKMMGKGQDLSVVNDLLTTHRGEDYAHQVVHQLHLMERLKKSDWNPVTEYSMVAANLSTADALAHYYGPFFQLYIDENPDMSMEEIKESNRQKLAKDKLKLRAGPMKDGLDSIKFQYKGRKVRILGNEHIKELIEKKNPSKDWDLTMEEVDILAGAYRDYNTAIIGKKALKFERFGTVKIPTSFDEVDTPSEIVTSAIREKNFFSEGYFPMFFTSDLSVLTAMKIQAGDKSIRIKGGYHSSGWRTWTEPMVNTTAYHLMERQLDEGQDTFDFIDTDFADMDYKVSQICKNKDGFYLWDGKRRIPFDSVSYAKLLGGKGQFNIKHSSGNDKIFDLTIGLLWVKDSLKVIAISFDKDKKNPGWRHGEQMEDDPFAEYFEENVEGDENVSEE